MRYKGYFVTSELGEIFIKHTKYAPWVFWSDSDGSLFVEVPNHFVLNYFMIKENDNFIKIYYDGLAVGTFSKISGMLNLRLTPTKVSFNGKLTPITN